MKIKWRHRQHCEWSRQQHILLYVIKWQMIRFQALWKTKSFVKVCLKFKLPLWTKGLLIHLSPLWQLPPWHFPRWHNFPVICETWIIKTFSFVLVLFPLNCILNQNWACFCFFVLFCFKINIDIATWSKLSVRETQKWHKNFNWPCGSWVIDQNMRNVVLINNSRTSWPTKIIMPFWSFSGNLLQDIVFQNISDFFLDSAQNMPKFGFRCSPL